MRHIFDEALHVILSDIVLSLVDLPLDVPVVHDYGDNPETSLDERLAIRSYHGISILYSKHKNELIFDGETDAYEFELYVPFPFTTADPTQRTYFLKLFFPKTNGDVSVSHSFNPQEFSQWQNVMATLQEVFDKNCKLS